MKVLASAVPSIITAFGTLICVFIGGRVSAKATHENDLQKLIQEKRAEVYFDFYETVEEILADRTIVFDQNYLDKIKSYKPKVKLLASSETYSCFEDFFNYVRFYLHNYRKFYSENDPYNDPDKSFYIEDDDGTLMEQYKVTPDDEEHFSSLLLKYKHENNPTVDDVEEHVTNLFRALRNDLGNTLL